MKHFNQFYEVGNNRYHTITADDELYIATESFITIKPKTLTSKQKDLTQGLKLLKFSAPIAILFDELNKCEVIKEDDDLTTYKKVKDVKNKIIKACEEVINNEKQQYEEMINENYKGDEGRSKEDILKEVFEQIEVYNPIGNTIIVDEPTNPIIKYIMRNGNMKHLYTERVTAFAYNTYIFSQDDFGTLTIFRIMTVKGVVKCIDTFIYDKKVIEKLFNKIYEEGKEN